MEMRVQKKERILTTSFMTKVSVLSVMGFLLMMFQIKIPFCPPFMDLDLGDLPSVIGTLVLGTSAGIWIEFIKNLIYFFVKDSTAGVGELANFLVGIAYLIPIGLLHNKFKSFKSYLAGALIGSFFMVITACLFNYFVLIPVYAIMFGMPLDAIIGMTQEVNPIVTDLKTLIFFSVAPFNIVKAIILGVLGYFMYKLVIPFVRN